MADLVQRLCGHAGDDMLANHIQHRGGKPAGGTHSRKALVTMKYHRFCSHRPRAEFLLYSA